MKPCYTGDTELQSCKSKGWTRPTEDKQALPVIPQAAGCGRRIVLKKINGNWNFKSNATSGNELVVCKREGKTPKALKPSVTYFGFRHFCSTTYINISQVLQLEKIAKKCEHKPRQNNIFFKSKCRSLLVLNGYLVTSPSKGTVGNSTVGITTRIIKLLTTLSGRCKYTWFKGIRPCVLCMSFGAVSFHELSLQNSFCSCNLFMKFFNLCRCPNWS